MRIDEIGFPGSRNFFPLTWIADHPHFSLFPIRTVADIVKPPELTQAKVNKALIALVKAKHVTKTSNNVSLFLSTTRRACL